MVTIKDIANRLGISVSTVSKGLNGASDISEDLRQMVLDTAVEMGYQSKKMKKDENKKLCLFIENMEYETANQFGYEIILGFRQAAFRNGWSVSVVGFDDLPISSFLEPPLTTVRQERTELGKCGYAALSNLINHVSVSMTLLRPQLITRASTAPCAEREEEAEEE